MDRRRNRSHKRPILLLIAVFLVLATAAAVYLYTQRQIDRPVETTQTQTEKTSETKTTLRLIATGDMLPHDAVNQQALQADGSYDYLPMFEPVKKYMTSADISFCNQEAPSAPSMRVTGYPAFNAPRAFAENLQQVGCNVINLANNHSNDKGQAGISETRDVWDNLKTLAVSGTARSAAEQNHIAYFEKEGIKFAFLSYTYCSNIAPSTSYGVNMLTKDLAGPQIAEAKAQANIVLVGAHWCRENTHTETTTQREWAQYFADQGVDIVIGTGPHWLQPVEKFARSGGGETIVWHSLGNFLNSQVELEGLISGIAVMDIDIASKTVTKLSFLPTYMHYEWTAAQAAASDYLARKNLKLYPLDQAAEPLSRSLLSTTVEEQRQKVTSILNRSAEVTILTSGTF